MKRTITAGVFVLLGVLFVHIPAAASLKCYDCLSKDTFDDCGAYISKNKELSKECPLMCYEETYAHSEGVFYTKRGCGVANQCDNARFQCNVCPEDLCNDELVPPSE